VRNLRVDGRAIQHFGWHPSDGQIGSYSWPEVGLWEGWDAGWRKQRVTAGSDSLGNCYGKNVIFHVQNESRSITMRQNRVLVNG
jgi:hypothetical protein